MKTDLPHPKKLRKWQSMKMTLVITVLSLTALLSIAQGLTAFYSDFNQIFVLYSGIAGLLIAIFWSLILLIIIVLSKIDVDAQNKQSQTLSTLFGVLFFCASFWIFQTTEKPLTLYYVDHYINKEGAEYVLCDEKRRPMSNAESSKNFVFARNDVGCSPYDALKLRTLNKPSDREKIERLNADYDHINKQD
tara:strand:- start:67 stop:639 length:573 start_codon:yes stop_codon:yes gene_type:complete